MPSTYTLLRRPYALHGRLYAQLSRPYALPFLAAFLRFLIRIPQKRHGVVFEPAETYLESEAV